jgi:hypothetical protein
VLSGIVFLLDEGNEAAGFLVCRHLYEWTMHAAYMQEKCSEVYKQQDWKAAYELFEQADTGNAWIKKHGKKYAPELPLEELPDQLRLKHFVAAYERFQEVFWGREKDEVRDTYGLLSEHSHPNGACFLAYRKIVAGSYVFGNADDTALPHPLPYLLDWIICVRALLLLASETAVKKNLDGILSQVVNASPRSV